MKMELMAALLHRPKVLVPGRTDHRPRRDQPEKGARVFAPLQHRARSVVTMLTSHYMQDIEALCERVIVINDGRIIFDGPSGHDHGAFRQRENSGPGVRGAGRQPGFYRDGRGRRAHRRNGETPRVACGGGGGVPTVVRGVSRCATSAWKTCRLRRSSAGCSRRSRRWTAAPPEPTTSGPTKRVTAPLAGSLLAVATALRCRAGGHPAVQTRQRSAVATKSKGKPHHGEKTLAIRHFAIQSKLGDDRTRSRGAFARHPAVDGARHDLPCHFRPDRARRRHLVPR